MKIRASRPELADALSWVSQVVPKRPNLPVLAGVRLTAHEGVLTISGFDYEASHQARVTVDVVGEGECVASATFVRDVVNSLRGTEVELVVDGDRLTIQAGRATYRTQVLAVGDYPTLPALPQPVGTIDAKVLSSAITTCRAPIDDLSVHEKTRGLRLEADGDVLTTVGLQPAMVIAATSPWSPREDLACTVPVRALEAAAKGLTGEVTLRRTGGLFGLNDGHRAVTMRIFDMPYAPWNQVIRDPGADAFAATVDVDDLADAVKRAGAVARDTALVLTIDAGEISIKAAGGEHGGAEHVVIESDGELTLGMDWRLFLDTLGAMPPGKVRLGFEGAMRVVSVRPVADDSRVAVVMPRRLLDGAA